jgi:hypothetical protein
MGLFEMRYREGQIILTGLVEATTPERAEELGREYCARTSKRRFISVRDAVLVKEPVVEVVPAQPAKKAS